MSGRMIASKVASTFVPLRINSPLRHYCKSYQRSFGRVIRGGYMRHTTAHSRQSSDACSLRMMHHVDQVDKCL